MKAAQILSLILQLSPLAATQSSASSWVELPPLPDAEGFAAPYAGVSGGALIVAGGANFPDAPPWRGGTKTWYDSIYVLTQPDATWRLAGRLPQPAGYGLSLSTPEGLVCLGGCSASAHFRQVFRLHLQPDGRLIHTPLPPLPQPCAYMAGVQHGSTLYLAGGTDQPDATRALSSLWALDLAEKTPTWQELPPCPGPARILATMGAHGDALYLFSGAALKADAAGKPTREWLRDAWRYTPATRTWQRLADLPRVAVAAPGPAPLVSGHLLVIGGDDGVHADFEPKEAHPGFPRDVLAYDPASDAWSTHGSVPFSLVTTSAVEWQGRIIIPGGEARPGKRSPRVWSHTP